MLVLLKNSSPNSIAIFNSDTRTASRAQLLRTHGQHARPTPLSSVLGGRVVIDDLDAHADRSSICEKNHAEDLHEGNSNIHSHPLGKIDLEVSLIQCRLRQIPRHNSSHSFDEALLNHGCGKTPPKTMTTHPHRHAKSKRRPATFFLRLNTTVGFFHFPLFSDTICLTYSDCNVVTGVVGSLDLDFLDLESRHFLDIESRYSL